jgi:hypothetical protein
MIIETAALILSTLALGAATVALWRVSVSDAANHLRPSSESVVRHEIVHVPYSTVAPGVVIPPDDGQIERDADYDLHLLELRQEFPELAAQMEAAQKSGAGPERYE